MRTIGILGGIGPQATMSFEAKVHRAAQRLIPQRGNRGYPPMVTVYMRHPPVEVGEDQRPTSPLTLDPRLLESARKLGEWAEILVIPSNTPHFFLDELRAAAGCQIVSLIDVTIDELRRRRVDTVGLLGLGVPRIYRERLDEEKLRVITAAEQARDNLDRGIIRLMEGAETEEDRRAAQVAVEELRGNGAPAIVLGCTEIPLLLGEAAAGDDLVDPAELLAEAVVRRALDPTEAAGR